MPSLADILSRWRAALVGALAFPLLMSFAPIWSVWYIGPRCGLGERGTVWTAMARIPANAEQVGLAKALSLFFEFDEFNSVAFAVCVWLGAGLGVAGSCWWREVRSAGGMFRPIGSPPMTGGPG